MLPQELISVDGTSLQLVKEASDRPWIRPEDEECRPGDLLLAAGQRLGAADLARLASCGIAALTVAQQPCIGLLISGDELVPPGTARQPGAIWESNGTLLETMLRALGQSVTQRRVVADQPDALLAPVQGWSGERQMLKPQAGVNGQAEDAASLVFDPSQLLHNDCSCLLYTSDAADE